MSISSQPELAPLHIRNVTDFMVKRIPSFSQLDGDPASRDGRYLTALTDQLKSCDLKPTRLFGASLVVVKPEIDGEELPIAVKIFKPDDIGYRMAGERLKMVHPSPLLKVAQHKGYFRLSNKPDIHSLNDLHKDEMSFLFYAYEHSLYEQLYQPYVLPALFTRFTAENDISHRHLSIPKDGVVYAMVQNFEDLVPLCSEDGMLQLNEKQKVQLSDFKQKMVRVEKETGYFPDETMFSAGGSNLFFTKDGRLILIDTNVLRNTKTSNRRTFETILSDIDRLIQST